MPPPKPKRKIYSKRRINPAALPSTASEKSQQLHRSHSEQIAKFQLLNWDPSSFMSDLRAKISNPVSVSSGEAQLKEQLKILHARHLFVTARMTVREIANAMRLKASSLYEWVDMYDWRSMREAIHLRKTNYFMQVQTVNEFQLEQSVDKIFSKIQTVCNDLLDAHLDGDERMKAAEVKAISDTVRTSFEVRGAMLGSSKVGQKMEVKLSLEMQTQVNEMMKHVKVAATPPRQITSNPDALRIVIEDAEFDTV